MYLSKCINWYLVSQMELLVILFLLSYFTPLCSCCINWYLKGSCLLSYFKKTWLRGRHSWIECFIKALLDWIEGKTYPHSFPTFREGKNKLAKLGFCRNWLIPSVLPVCWDVKKWRRRLMLGWYIGILVQFLWENFLRLALRLRHSARRESYYSFRNNHFCCILNTESV